MARQAQQNQQTLTPTLRNAVEIVRGHENEGGAITLSTQERSVLYEVSNARLANILPSLPEYTNRRGNSKIRIEVDEVPSSYVRSYPGGFLAWEVYQTNEGLRYYGNNAPIGYIEASGTQLVFHISSTALIYRTSAQRRAIIEKLRSIASTIVLDFAPGSFEQETTEYYRNQREENIQRFTRLLENYQTDIQRITNEVAHLEEEKTTLEREPLPELNFTEQVEALRRFRHIESVTERAGRLFVITKPVTIEYENFRYPFGSFLLVISPSLGISAYGEHPVAGYCHPYAHNGGSICYGELQGIADTYRRDLNLFELVVTTITLLSSFTESNPYRNITDWISVLNAQPITQ